MWYLYLFNGLSAGSCLLVAEKPFASPNKEMGYLWDRGNPQPFIFFSIMATINGNSCNATGSSQNANNEISNIKSWADSSEEFSTNLKERNAFTNLSGELFFVIKRNDGDFSKTSPFLIQKAIQSTVEPKNIKKL